jgi:hypothetical protein
VIERRARATFTSYARPPHSREFSGFWPHHWGKGKKGGFSCRIAHVLGSGRGRAAAAAAVIGLAAYMTAVGLDQAARLAAPIGLVIALAALFAPYLLPAFQPPVSPSAPPADPVPGPGGIVIIADRGGVAAQHIRDVTMNPPGSGAPDSPAGQ